MDFFTSLNQAVHTGISSMEISRAILCFDFFRFHGQAVINELGSKFLRRRLPQLC
jgi:hypothetical protein